MTLFCFPFSGLIDSTEMCLLSPFSSQSEADLSLPLLISSSPGPNKSCCFQREPPEGCEKIRVWEETRYFLKNYYFASEHNRQTSPSCLLWNIALALHFCNIDGLVMDSVKKKKTEREKSIKIYISEVSSSFIYVFLLVKTLCYTSSSKCNLKPQ